MAKQKVTQQATRIEELEKGNMDTSSTERVGGSGLSSIKEEVVVAGKAVLCSSQDSAQCLPL